MNLLGKNQTQSHYKWIGKESKDPAFWVLDIDGTIIHHFYDSQSNNIPIEYLNFSKIKSPWGYFILRPELKEFLEKKIKPSLGCALWTTGSQTYANQVYEKIMKPFGIKCDFLLSMDHCDYDFETSTVFKNKNKLKQILTEKKDTQSIFNCDEEKIESWMCNFNSINLMDDVKDNFELGNWSGLLVSSFSPKIPKDSLFSSLLKTEYNLQ